jgi:GDP-4-dehydro-6-deoxy-D-mannose reductase
MNTTSRILITGAAGLSGKWLNSLLLEKGFQNISLTDRDKYKECDITKKDAVNKLIAEIKPEYVFHLAGLIPPEIGNYKEEEYYNVNVLGTRNLLESLIENNLWKTKVLIISSSSVYGNEGRNFISEDFKLNPKTNNYYGVSKVQQEEISIRFIEESKLPIIIARPVNNFILGSKLFLPNCAKKIIQCEKNNETLKEKPMDAYRDYLDTRDVVNAYYLLMLKGNIGQVYNVSAGKAFYNKELFEFMAGKANIKYEIEEEKTDGGYLKYQVLDNKKLIKDTGWQPKYDIKDTLLEIMNYWRTKL